MENFETTPAPSGGMQSGQSSSFEFGGFKENTVLEPVQKPFAAESRDVASEIMETPGTVHDKLGELASRDVEESSKKDPYESKIEKLDEDKNENKGDYEKEELSFEQRAMLLQLEVMKLIAEAMKRGKKDDKKAPELIKKLQQMLEEAQGDGKKPEKTGVISILLVTLGFLLTFTKQGIETFEKEPSRN